jgi:MoxR-like ATPase
VAEEPQLVHPDEVRKRLDEVGYLVNEGLATALALALSRPATLAQGRARRGEDGSGQGAGPSLGAPLLRLQCYEGVTAGEALYEWNYQRQLLAIRLAESHHRTLHDADLFTEEFLQERPILQAVRCTGPLAPILLIDEIDRADDEFEALLFEFLGEASVTVPELGKFVAARRPTVVLTSNRSRDLHDALRRRCLYHWIEYPDADRVVAILRRSVPSARESLVTSTAAFVGRVRTLDLDKTPGLAEAIDWLSALTVLGVADLTRDDVVRTLGAIAKSPDDGDLVRSSVTELGERAGRQRLRVLCLATRGRRAAARRRAAAPCSPGWTGPPSPWPLPHGCVRAAWPSAPRRPRRSPVRSACGSPDRWACSTGGRG